MPGVVGTRGTINESFGNSGDKNNMFTLIKKYLAKRKEEIFPYEQIRDSLQTGDLINCEPAGWIWALVGHTAKVYKCPLTGQLYCYESTQTKREGGESGVQLRPLREWVRQYNGTLRIRYGEYTGYVGGKSAGKRRHKAEQLAAEHVKKHRGKSYPNLKTLSGLWRVVNAAIDLPWKSRLANEDNMKNPFCTHLAVDQDRYMGRLIDYHSTDDLLNPAEWEPDDTRDDCMFSYYYAPGFSYSKEIRIK